MTTEETIDELVRDLTSVVPRSKSEVRRRIQQLLEDQKREILGSIVKAREAALETLKKHEEAWRAYLQAELSETPIEGKSMRQKTTERDTERLGANQQALDELKEELVEDKE